MPMPISTFYLPVRIISGPGSLAQLGAEAKKLGKKALLVTGSGSLRKSGVLDGVLKNLKESGVETIIFDKVMSNPRTTIVDEGARMAKSVAADLVIGMGGGSAMDAAKGIALASSGTESVWYYVEAGAKAEIKGTVLPLLLVPTVAASGSEINTNAVLTHWESNEKRVLSSPLILAKTALIDPALTLTLPARTTAQGGVDTFCHVVESYITTKNPFPLTDGIMETTMKLAVETLPQVLAKLDDIEGRTRLSWASTVACSRFASLGGGGGAMTLHGVQHPLSAYFDIAHGDGLAALLPAWMRYTQPARPERFSALGKNVFGESDGVQATEKWLEKVGMRLRLRDLGVKSERFEEMANNAVRTASFISAHPRPLDAAVITQLYRESY